MISLTSRTNPISQFLKPSSRTLIISLFSTSSSPHHNSSSSSSVSSRRYDDESRSVRVSVWWDIENCTVPTGVNVFKIAHSITSAVRANGIKGPVQITAFGDIFCLNRASQEALSSTGVNLIHIPHGGKNNADRSLLVDLMYWVSQNPPPAHIFLISGDNDFAGILHKLRMSNYNILLSAREVKNTSGVLYSASSIMWYWNDLAKGENLSGKHFNQPPDGPFNSWYGHYRGPLEDPFTLSELQKNPEAEDPSNSESESNLRPVPMAVLRQLCRVLNSHPDGLSITELRHQLKAGKVVLDKNFYGHKKFSQLLKSFPRIVKVLPHPDGQFFLKPVSTSSPEPVDSSGRLLTANENGKTPTITRMVDVEEKSIEKGIEKSVDKIINSIKEKPAEEITRMVDAHVKPIEEASEKKVAEIINKMEEKPAEETSEKIMSDVFVNENGVASVEHPNRKEALNEKIVVSPERLESDVIPESLISEEEKSKSPNALYPVAKAGSVGKSETNLGFIDKIINWCKAWRSESDVDKPIELQSPTIEPSSVVEDARKPDEVPHSKQLANEPSPPRKHEIFTKNSFWNALRSFFKTHRGSDIVLNSLSREHIAEKLRKEGPLILRPLEPAEVLHLVNLLIAEKKWIQELPTSIPPYRLVSLYQESSISPQTHNPTGLSSILLNTQSPDNPQLRVSSTAPTTLSEKSRIEILSDCQKLLDESLSQCPDGFNMGGFKRQFLNKYGYTLDHQKLGYPKLVSLLQAMPGIKIESTHILSDNVVYSPGIQSLGLEKSTGSESELSDSARKDDEVKPLWDELGPVAKSDHNSMNGANGEYESTMSVDDEFSSYLGKEEHSSSSKLVKGEKQSKSMGQEEENESSLMQILDSWYANGTKEESNLRNNHGSYYENPPDSFSEDENSMSGSPTAEVKNGQAESSDDNGCKYGDPKKRYTFVTEGGNEVKRGKVIDGILGGLKKTGGEVTV